MLFSKLIAAALLPPFCLLWLGGWGFRLGWTQLGRRMIGLSLLGLWLLCTPFVAQHLLRTLEIPPAPITGMEAEAIVVLGGGIRARAPEYGGGDTLNWRTLERIRYGARLHRETRRPILVTGGAPEGDTPEGPVMRAVLEQEFGVPVDWVEARSLNTRQNARYSAELLRAAGIRRIYLVSHIWHLPRAIPEFEREGLTVVPAGTGYQSRGPYSLFDFLPSAAAMGSSYYALHEWLGRLWYRLQG